MTDNLRDEYPDIPVIYAGGVMSNRRIQSRLSEREGVFFAKPEFSADNAAGIALLCRERARA
jgi:N6-L-threonylcarbamoyladenine synthase